MENLIDDLNYNIVTEELLEDDKNIEMLETAMDNWKELIAQIRRERKRELHMARRWEMNAATMEEFGIMIL